MKQIPFFKVAVRSGAGGDPLSSTIAIESEARRSVASVNNSSVDRVASSNRKSDFANFVSRLGRGPFLRFFRERSAVESFAYRSRSDAYSRSKSRCSGSKIVLVREEASFVPSLTDVVRNCSGGVFPLAHSSDSTDRIHGSI